MRATNVSTDKAKFGGSKQAFASPLMMFYMASSNENSVSEFDALRASDDRSQEQAPAQSQAVVVERIIQGITSKNMPFRPADWAERLCGVMSCFRPEGYAGRNAHLTYSNYVKPTVINGIKSVAVDEALRELQPLAYHFVMSFAQDNDLQFLDACLLPEK